jgi:membrane-associated protease RseP (regulator of RpoE activity)
MSVRKSFVASIVAAAAALVLGGVAALAQNEQAPGRIVRIGPDDDAVTVPTLPPPAQANRPEQPAAPEFWVGILGGPVTPELRAHVELPEGQGVLVREVRPNSPAAQAGIKVYDIVLRAGETPIREMADLAELVRVEGQRDGQLTLEVVRKGQRETAWVKPEKRPADLALQPEQPAIGGGVEGLPFLNNNPALRQMLEGLMGGENGFEFRQFGPGVILGEDGFRGAFRGMPDMPSGVSISVQKEGDQPARATVERGEERWEVRGDDPESLKQLPEDLRPAVERLLRGDGALRMQMRDLDGDGENDAAIAAPGTEGARRPAVGRLRERLDRMQRELEELYRMLPERNQAPQQQDR